MAFPKRLPDVDNALLWTNPHELDEISARQIRNVASLPWTVGVRVMPDVHAGYGVTVGSVVAMDAAVSPAAVGVDIGCGMAAVPTSLTAADLPDNLRRLRSGIEAAVPVGFAAHKQAVDVGTRADWQDFWVQFTSLHPEVHGKLDRAEKQMGTLGGGNHFIELCTDETGRVWITLHSGSRHIGKSIADAHVAVAKTLEHNQNLPDPELAVLVEKTPQFEAYLHDLYWAQDYAARNRGVMLELIKTVVHEQTGAEFGEPIQCHHNYVAEEEHGGRGVYVTRKGAIAAGRGQMGLIPGSMATGSYVVSGLGNTDSYCSASHGAGRRMSRTQARKRISLKDFRESVAGVECRTDKGVLDEAPAAYKDLEQVIKAQTDGPNPLVKVEHKLDTILCVKG